MMDRRVWGKPARTRSRGRPGLGGEMLVWRLVDVDPF
jgi:hypothetical protein